MVLYHKLFSFNGNCCTGKCIIGAPSYQRIQLLQGSTWNEPLILLQGITSPTFSTVQCTFVTYSNSRTTRIMVSEWDGLTEVPHKGRFCVVAPYSVNPH